jgi:hypothetical protein
MVFMMIPKASSVLLYAVNIYDRLMCMDCGNFDMA